MLVSFRLSFTQKLFHVRIEME